MKVQLFLVRVDWFK